MEQHKEQHPLRLYKLKARRWSRLLIAHERGGRSLRLDLARRINSNSRCLVGVWCLLEVPILRIRAIRGSLVGGNEVSVFSSFRFSFGCFGSSFGCFGCSLPVSRIGANVIVRSIDPLQGTAPLQHFNTHVFAPPVTGAPIKKSKYSSSNLASQGSLGEFLFSFILGSRTHHCFPPPPHSPPPCRQPPIFRSSVDASRRSSIPNRPSSRLPSIQRCRPAYLSTVWTSGEVQGWKVC
jgi:hypothetical protein